MSHRARSDAYALYQRGASPCSRSGTGRRPPCRSRRPGAWNPIRPRSARRSAAPTFAAVDTASPPGEFEAVVERNPANDYAHFCLGRSFEKLGDRPAASRHLSLAAGMRPDREDYRRYRDRLKAA